MKCRTIVRTIATGAVVGSISTTASAQQVTEPKDNSERHNELQSKYAHSDEISSVVSANGSDILSTLKKEAVIDFSDAGKLSALSASTNTQSDDRLSVSSTVDHKTEVLTAFIRIEEEISDGTVSIFVLPESEREYATVEYDTGEKRLFTTDTVEHSAEEDDEVGPECVYHSTHGDWQLIDTDIECDWSDNCAGGADCTDDPLTACAWDHYTQNTYEVYECGHVDYCPGDVEIECSATQTELINAVCTSDCCEDDGPGCTFAGCGC